MPVDIPKHPSLYPIWMRQAIECVLEHPKERVFAVSVRDDAHERSLRRYFRAYVKTLRKQIIPQWTKSRHEAFLRGVYTLTKAEGGGNRWLELSVKVTSGEESRERLETAWLMREVVGLPPESGTGK